MAQLSVYLKRELIKYIKQELDKGVKLAKIQETLLTGGHNRTLIDEAIYDLKRHKYDIVKALREPLKLDSEAEELYMDIMESLVKYVRQQMEDGNTITEVKDNLKTFGHAENIINKAIDRVLKDKKSARFNIKMNKILLSSISLFVVLFAISAITTESFALILVGFFPTILMLLVGALFRGQRNLLIALPFLLAIIFFLLGRTIPLIANMEVATLTLFNLIFSLIIAIVIYDKAKKDDMKLKLKWNKKEREFAPKLVKL